MTHTRKTPPLSWPHAQERFHTGRGTGYRLQMLLKLAVAVHVKTEFYLTLDLDVFMTRDSFASDLIFKGKVRFRCLTLRQRLALTLTPTVIGQAIIQGEGRHGNGKTQHKERWWRAARAILNSTAGLVLCHGVGCRRDGPEPVPLEPLIGVTPAVLSRTVALLLQVEIERVNSQLAPLRWDEMLFKILGTQQWDWTEYTLYWVFACKARLIPKYHLVSSTYQANPLYGYSGFNLDKQHLWKRLHGHVKEDYFQSANRSIFGVLQSISGVNPLFIIEKLAPFVSSRRCYETLRDVPMQEIMLGAQVCTNNS